jgi:hypothetical protein
MIPMPAQVRALENVAVLGDARLWYWDTGGAGEPILLLHPNSGSALTWPVSATGLFQGGVSRHRLLTARTLRVFLSSCREPRKRLRGPP